MSHRIHDLRIGDPALPAGERSFRMGWHSALRRTDGSRPVVTADYVARQGRALRVVDVRGESDLLGVLGHVPGSDWVPIEEAGTLHSRVGAFDPLVLVCEDGTRSLTLAAWLEEAGLAMVAAMQGGMHAWRERGLAPAHDTELPSRRGLLSPLLPWANSTTHDPFSRDEIASHVGNPRSVRWIKVAAFLLSGRMSCVDGRDHVAVVGSPGGDAGELILALAALEQLGERPLPDATVAELLRRRLDAFGRFAFHTDTTAGNRMIASLRADPRTQPAVAGITDPVAFRRFFSSPPEAIREALLDHLSRPEHIGCGHLRLMIQQPDRWGVRAGLVQQVLRAALSLRWRGVEEIEVTPLPGGHSEGAVLNIHVPGGIDAYSRVPLVAPSIAGRQLFVNHPDVSSYLRRQLAGWLAQQDDLDSLPRPPDAAALFTTMQALHQQQLAATLGELAAGLPVYDVTVHRNGCAEVIDAGSVPKRAA